MGGTRIFTLHEVDIHLIANEPRRTCPAHIKAARELAL